jgi:translation elongation factor EF-1alpha
MKIEKGSVIYGNNEKPHKTGSFSAKIFMIKNFNTKSARKFTIKISNNNIAIKKIKINRIFSPISAVNVVYDSFAIVPANNVAYAEISLAKPYPVEKYADYSELGRFAIYENENFVGVGIIE